MSDAIEVLKDLKRQYSDYCNEYQLEDDNKFIDALDEALLALEQKEDDRKQDALKELARMRNYIDTIENFNKEHQKKINSTIIKRIKELEEGVEK